MKKAIFGAFVLAVATLTAQAQDQPERKQKTYKSAHHQDAFAHLNLSEEQKTKLKAANEDFRKQLQELKKNDDITVKEQKTRMTTLRKEHYSQLQSLLTTEQKAQLEKGKEKRMTKQEPGKTRADKMKERLGLTDEQVEKVKQSDAETASKMKALREDKSLSDEERAKQAKELRKAQQKALASILTEDQLNKLHDKHRSAK